MLSGGSLLRKHPRAPALESGKALRSLYSPGRMIGARVWPIVEACAALRPRPLPCW